MIFRDRRLAPALFALLMLCSVDAPAAAQDPRPPRFMVVAPDILRRELMDYYQYKSKDIATDVVSFERAISVSKGVDDAEKLKNFIYTFWRDHNTKYVLLVGDADMIPVRYMVLDRVTPPAFDYAFYPSDLYYADVAKGDRSFEDWNGAKDDFHKGYFGEVRGEKNKKNPINFDAIDYKPEVAVGRWPVSTAEETRRMVEKTIRRDQASRKREPWVDRVGAVAVGGWVDARPSLDAVAKSLAPPWKIEKRYFADPEAKDKTAPPTEDEVVSLLNGGVGLLCHAGHGSDETWEQCLSVASIAKLKNADKLPVMISVGCSTARFAVLPPYEPYLDVAKVEHRGTNAGEVFTAPPPPPAIYQRGRFNMTGLGERLLRDGQTGAVAYIGCNTGSQPCALTLLEGFAKAVGESKEPRLGDCWNAAIKHYWDAQKLATIVPTDDWYPASIFFQGMKFMVFGDPTLRL